MNLRLLCIALLSLLSLGAEAHRPSDAELRLRLQQQTLTAVLQLAVVDADRALDLDTNGDRELVWGEIRQAQGRLQQWLNESLPAYADTQRCPWQLAQPKLSDRLAEPHLWLELEALCPQGLSPDRLEYRLLFSIDPTHRGLAHAELNGEQVQQVLSPAQPDMQLTARGELTRWLSFVRSGIHHIWIGYDHLLFLLSLLLPAVLLWRGDRWQAAPSAGAACLRLLWVVTAFTLAHSITLALATLNLVQLPIAWVERAIAASVVLAALNNIRPLVAHRHALLAFGFGLLHGFGFAAVLAETGLTGSAILAPLLGFNIGVEIGQLALVLVALPALLWLRHREIYGRWIMPAGSALIAIIALLWLIERF